MTAFSGIIATKPSYPASMGFAGDSRTISQYPYPATYKTSAPVVGALGNGQPPVTSHTAAASPGYVRGGFAADWFNRIHITPGLIALGNLVSGISKTVKVWNAWLTTTQTLDTVVGKNTDGITLTGPGALPMVFQPNQELTWTAGISTNGSPVIAATYTYSFDDGEAVVLSITGQRISAFALSPNWASPVSEKLEWKTDVLQAWSGAEQRRALRIAPRRTFGFEVLLHGRERRYIEAQLFDWSARVWALPIWPDGQRLAAKVSAGASTIPCDTVSRDFAAGAMAIFITDALTYEVVQVLSVTASAVSLVNPVQNTWAAGTRFYPVRAARLAGYPKIKRDSAEFASMKPEFLVVEPCDWAAASGVPSYRSTPVVENSPAEGGIETAYSRQTVTIDNETGSIEVDDRPGVGMPTHSHDWFLQGRTARANYRALLYLLKGRQGEAWVPSYQQDLKLVADVTNTQQTIDVEMTGYTLYLFGQLNRQDIRVELKNGAVYYKRVTGSVVVDANTERLSIDSTFAAGFKTTDVRRISFMAVARLATDAVEIEHLTMADGLATSVTPWQILARNI